MVCQHSCQIWIKEKSPWWASKPAKTYTKLQSSRQDLHFSSGEANEDPQVLSLNRQPCPQALILPLASRHHKKEQDRSQTPALLAATHGTRRQHVFITHRSGKCPLGSSTSIITSPSQSPTPIKLPMLGLLLLQREDLLIKNINLSFRSSASFFTLLLKGKNTNPVQASTEQQNHPEYNAWQQTPPERHSAEGGLTSAYLSPHALYLPCGMSILPASPAPAWLLKSHFNLVA